MMSTYGIKNELYSIFWHVEFDRSWNFYWHCWLLFSFRSFFLYSGRAELGRTSSQCARLHVYLIWLDDVNHRQSTNYVWAFPFRNSSLRYILRVSTRVHNISGTEVWLHKITLVCWTGSLNIMLMAFRTAPYQEHHNTTQVNIDKAVFPINTFRLSLEYMALS